MAIQFCGVCGKPLLLEQRFCQRCGSPKDSKVALQTGYPAQQPTLAPQGMLYCDQCGLLLSAQDHTCRRCGAAVRHANVLAGGQGVIDAPTVGINLPDTFHTPFTPGPVTPKLEEPATPVLGVQPRSGRGRRWLVLLIVLVALGLISGGIAALVLYGGPGTPTGGNGGGTATLTPTLNAGSAQALIQEFYDDVNAHNYGAAYALLSDDWHKRQSLQDFTVGYQNTAQSTPTIQSTQQLADGTFQVTITLVALESRNGTQVNSMYAGFYIVGIENGMLRLLSGHLTRQSA